LDLEWKCRWKTLKRGELDRGGGCCGEDGIVDDLGDDDEVLSGLAMSKTSQAASKEKEKDGIKIVQKVLLV